jgi:hypothetical protein
MATERVDIIYGERASRSVEADTRDGELWLTAADLDRVSGWVLKLEGFCKDEVCVPVPPARKDDLAGDGRFNLAALARLLEQPALADPEHHVWCFGESAAERTRKLRSLEAPDFTLPDLAGRMHSLSEHRGKKVLLVSWASW